MAETPPPTETIYVRLLDEGTDVWRPTQGRRVGPMTYEVLPAPGNAPQDETWEFTPGRIVKCGWQPDIGGSGLIVSALALATPDLLARPRSVVEFLGRRDPGYAPWIDTLIDGKPLQQIVEAAEELRERKGAGPWEGSEPYELLPPKGSLVGGHGGVQLLVCADCREPGCDPVFAAVEVFDDVAAWSEFRQGNVTTKLPSVGPFVFDRDQYEAAVARAVEWDTADDAGR